nr:PTP [Cotesia vestalis bracovirus]
MATDLFTVYQSCHYLQHITESETKYIERIHREHHTIVNIQINGSCKECKKLKNIKKNRFQNIECWDSTRVCLKKKGSNYIHANYVDGFEQVRKFIVTQEPMDNTLEDYWSMVWQTGTRVIVMLNGADGPAVPSLAKKGITDISTLISFMTAVNERHQYYIQPGLMNLPGPIVVYSTTGIERAPTFCAVDICILQLVNSSIISIPSVVFNIRRQRRSSFEFLDHYVFINNVIVHFLATVPPNSELFQRFLCYRSL